MFYTAIASSSNIFLKNCFIFFSLILLCSCTPNKNYDNDGYLQQRSPISYSSDIFIKPKVQTMRRLNPLKLLFVVVYSKLNQQYEVEWNLNILKTIIMESEYVTDDDRKYFMDNFSTANTDYQQWSPDKHDQLERFTEKYFNPYKSADLFLPFQDCQTFTYALTDEMLNELGHKDTVKRYHIRQKAAERLCGLD
ncbi:unnamed protein product [Didymodactylos carnosus]|uniref:Uncharacterized protein n=1 Tax=Didymodactylos carnosus TaxID=1234261 RepID=A0A815BMH7_9BILA|nr:unnamed protein product [Didymodactylos carnosus]CAF1382746.1 unnamed protein product [Didymodactylos carnosus]CAF4061902.1 unnamed protein product [Didymodactylos carnosus]CAF4191103.1 unnamed protein product [Didymodactylos carnosus]